MADAATPTPQQVADALLAAVPVFETIVHPQLSPDVIKELWTVGAIYSVAALTYAITMVIILVRAYRGQESIWIARKVQRTEGTYVLVNALQLWIPFGTAYTAFGAAIAFRYARIESGHLSEHNIILMSFLLSVPSSLAASMISCTIVFSSISTVDSVRGSSGYFKMPSPWLFHLLQFGVPTALVSGVIVTAVVSNNNYDTMVSITRQLLSVLDSLSGPIDTYTPELLQAISLSEEFATYVQLTAVWATAAISVLLAWCGIFLLTFIPTGILLTLELSRVIKIQQKSMNGRSKDRSNNTAGQTVSKITIVSHQSDTQTQRLLLKHRLLISYIVLSGLWATSEMTFGLLILVDRDWIAKQDADSKFHIQWLASHWISAFYSIAVAGIILIRCWKSDNLADNAEPTRLSQTVKKSMNVTASTTVHVESDFEEDAEKGGGLMIHMVPLPRTQQIQFDRSPELDYKNDPTMFN